MMEAIDYTTPRDILMRKEEGEAGFAGFKYLTCEQVFRIGEWAATNPEKWPTLKLKRKHPFWTCGELARELGISAMAVSRHLKAARKVLGRRIAV